MVSTGSVGGEALVRVVCVLCGRRFPPPTDHATLPAHVYPSGLYRGRPCASRHGVRA